MGDGACSIRGVRAHDADNIEDWDQCIGWSQHVHRHGAGRAHTPCGSVSADHHTIHRQTPSQVPWQHQGGAATCILHIQFSCSDAALYQDGGGETEGKAGDISVSHPRWRDNKHGWYGSLSGGGNCVSGAGVWCRIVISCHAYDSSNHRRSINRSSKCAGCRNSDTCHDPRVSRYTDLWHCTHSWCGQDT